MIAQPVPNLFWRTFVLLILLIILSVMGWLQSFRVLTELPYTRSTAEQIVSMANLTRYALITADPRYRPDLLMVLASREGVRILPKEEGDAVSPLVVETNYSSSVADIEAMVRRELGQDTVLASRVNGEKGLWVSFSIEGDEYWLLARSALINPNYGTAWLWWALAALVGTILGSVLISQRLSSPLKEIAEYARKVGRGLTPPSLPEDSGPSELREVNSAFNRMVQDIQNMENGREMLLAGVSHDLRTPITRLRLEAEIADLPDETRESMVSDLEQMEMIVNQFMDYARRSDQPLARVSLSETVQTAISTARIEIDGSIRLTSDIAPDVFVMAQPLELSRVVQNLFTNAMRYGRSDDSLLYLTVMVKKEKNNAVLVVSDQGPGLDPSQAERVLRPFERGDASRSGVSGTGLGLAIVDRIVRRSGGKVNLGASDPHGLTVTIQMPFAPAEKKARQGKTG
jgi:two-component system osmolarity sensor histidine kinase EnvZ